MHRRGASVPQARVCRSASTLARLARRSPTELYGFRFESMIMSCDAICPSRGRASIALLAGNVDVRMLPLSPTRPRGAEHRRWSACMDQCGTQILRLPAETRGCRSHELEEARYRSRSRRFIHSDKYQIVPCSANGPAETGVVKGAPAVTSCGMHAPNHKHNSNEQTHACAIMSKHERDMLTAMGTTSSYPECSTKKYRYVCSMRRREQKNGRKCTAFTLQKERALQAKS